MKKTEWKSPALLFLTAVVWGVAFVAQSVGMDYVGPFTFNCIRCLIGAVVLVPCIWFLDGWKQRPDGASCGRESARASCGRESTGAPSGASYGSHALLAGGICCGLALFVASNLQQIGIQYTTVGKAGFITALYIVMVPVFGIFLKKRAGIRVWVSVALAVAGLYLLCITDRLALGKGDILVLLCAVVFAVHILVVDHFSAKADGVRMSCIQFLVCGLLSGVCMLITEHLEMRLILQAWQPILYAGVFSCGVGYTLQISVAAAYYPKAFYLAVFNIYYHFTGTYSLGCVFKCHFVCLSDFLFLCRFLNRCGYRFGYRLVKRAWNYVFS